MRGGFAILTDKSHASSLAGGASTTNLGNGFLVGLATTDRFALLVVAQFRPAAKPDVARYRDHCGGKREISAANRSSAAFGKSSP